MVWESNGNGIKTPAWEWEWKGVGINTGGNGDDPYSHGENSHGIFYSPLAAWPRFVHC